MFHIWIHQCLSGLFFVHEQPLRNWLGSAVQCNTQVRWIAPQGRGLHMGALALSKAHGQILGSNHDSNWRPPSSCPQPTASLTFIFVLTFITPGKLYLGPFLS